MNLFDNCVFCEPLQYLFLDRFNPIKDIKSFIMVSNVFILSIYWKLILEVEKYFKKKLSYPIYKILC